MTRMKSTRVGNATQRDCRMTANTYKVSTRLIRVRKIPLGDEGPTVQ